MGHGGWREWDVEYVKDVEDIKNVEDIEISKRVSHKFWGTLFFFAKSCSFILPCWIFFVSLHL